MSQMGVASTSPVAPSLPSCALSAGVILPCRLLQHVDSLRQLEESDARLRQAVADSVPQWHEHPPTPLNVGMPVYVMLPLDTVWLTQKNGTTTGMLKREQALEVGLKALERAGVEGVMIDVWWGLVEHEGPGQYDFSAYKRLFEKVRTARPFSDL